jgi:signal peptidase I
VRTFVPSLLTAIAVAAVGCIALAGILWGQGWRAFVVHTGSMTPHIRSGELVIDQPVKTLHVGEVVTFAKVPGQYTTHRVAAVTPAGIKTKGDANPSDDFGYVTQPQVVGKVYAAIPYAGFVVVFCSHPAGIAGLVLLMCSIWLAWSLFLGKEKTSGLAAES